MPEYEEAGQEARHEAGYTAAPGPGPGGVDALLAALTDAPLPEGARVDARFMAEHRSAVADVALLREQLRMLGDTLADPPRSPVRPEPDARPQPDRRPGPGARVEPDRRPEPDAQAQPGARPEPDARPGPDPRPRPVARRPAGPSPAAAPPRAPPPPRPARRPPRYRRHAGVALGALAVAAGTAVLGGLVWLGVHGGGDATGSADRSAAREESTAGGAAESPARDLACARVLAEGTVRSVTAAAGGTVRVVLDVTRHYRPEQSAAEHPTVTVTLPADAREDLRAGTYALVRVPVHAEDGPRWETGRAVGAARAEILAALPQARGLTCAGPGGGSG